MAKVYVSSTFEDLKTYRARVRAQLLRMGHEIVSMEDYNADTKRPLDKCLADVRGADIYVGIIAWRYGYIPKDGNLKELCKRPA